MADSIDKKIAQFKQEAGNKEQYNTEQQKIYSAFTKKNGSKTIINVVDCEGISIRVCLDSSTEIRKILLKHYKTRIGTVTAKDILNMFDVMRTGKKEFQSGNYTYIKTKYRNINGVRIRYFLIIKLFPNGKDAVLKSFYTNEGYV